MIMMTTITTIRIAVVSKGQHKIIFEIPIRGRELTKREGHSEGRDNMYGLERIREKWKGRIIEVEYIIGGTTTRKQEGYIIGNRNIRKQYHRIVCKEIQSIVVN